MDFFIVDTSSLGFNMKDNRERILFQEIEKKVKLSAPGEPMCTVGKKISGTGETVKKLRQTNKYPGPSEGGPFGVAMISNFVPGENSRFF
jgi:hypothetical protein